MTPTDRLPGIISALQAYPWRRAEDLADALGVSTRTIYRDVRALVSAGVPVVAVPGRGYRLADGYVLPPLLLTADEAVALLLGGRFVAEHFDDAPSRAARAATGKVEDLLPPAVAEAAARMEESLRLVPVNVFDRPDEELRLRALRRALVESRRVRFRTSEDGRDETIDPYGLVEQGGAWYVVGYRRPQEAVQTLRVRTLEAVEVLEETYARPSGYRPARRPDAPAEVEVRVLFDRAVARWVREAPTAHAASVEDVPEGVRVTLRVRREAEVVPWLLGWGGHARVLAPASLRARLAREAGRIAAHYADDAVLW